jgi:NADH:ubiquinone oxidoreductase subunit 3 (subunit A)
MFRRIVHIYTYIPLVHIVPLLALITIITFTVRRLIRYSREHRRLLMTSVRQTRTIESHVVHSRRHRRKTLMLIAVVLLFLVCRCPMLIIYIYEVQYADRNDYISTDYLVFRCRIQRTFGTWTRFMQTINANGNLLIYLCFCRHFRKVSKTLVNRCFSRRSTHTNRSVSAMINPYSKGRTHSTDV